MASRARVVTLIGTPGCSHATQTEEHLRSLSRELGLELRVKHITVSSQSEAERLRMLGSPTVQIGGVDIERGSRSRTDFGFG